MIKEKESEKLNLESCASPQQLSLEQIYHQ
jgi:hypothetical protein